MRSVEPLEAGVSRRTLLRGAAGGAALLYAGALPAWARAVRHHSRLRRPDSLPFPHLPAGTPSMDKIRHVVVLMMENHSFDNLLGRIPYELPGRRAVDGLTFRRGRSANFNRDQFGTRYFAQRAPSPCQLHAVPSNAWNASHESFDDGLNDGFVRASGQVAMWYWDKHTLPFTYSLAERFPIGQRYFGSVLGQTYPNRRFFFTGTASGTISDNSSGFSIPAANGTIFDRLDAHQIDWGIYYQNAPSLAIVPGALNGRRSQLHSFDQFTADVAAGRLPQFTFIDPNYSTTSEENPQDVQVGEQFVAQVVNALVRAPTWRHTALFITYDEHGGYYDHVPPPRAIKPDSIAPLVKPGDAPAAMAATASAATAISATALAIASSAIAICASAASATSAIAMAR